jgi:3',5'-cyclic AMP phosphodiesterase CpdA
MPITRTSSLPLPVVGLLGLLAAAGCGDDTGVMPARVYAPAARLLVISDPHYFAPSLGTSGPAFETYLAHDRKLIAESDAIMRALVDLVAAEDPQFVLISVDLTKDGELLSHESAAAYLREIRAKGPRVLVVPGNHDIENGGASSYAGDTTTPVDTIAAADFAKIYDEFGYQDALARDPGSLSYVAELVPGLWLLALDSCIYGDTRGSSETGGAISEATRAWIAARLDEAKRQGIRVVGMMHHGLLEHFTQQALIFPEFLVNDRDAVAGLLSEGGVGAVFTGHFHANDITKGTPAGQTRAIYDIETGSAVTYPCPYRIVDLASDVLTITTKHVTTVDYDLGGAQDFQTHAHDSLRLGLESLIANLIQAPPYSLPADEAATLAPWLGDGLVAHYAGDEVMPADALAESQALLANPGFVEQLAGVMLLSIWTDLAPLDNQVTIDLATR